MRRMRNVSVSVARQAFCTWVFGWFGIICLCFACILWGGTRTLWTVRRHKLTLQSQLFRALLLCAQFKRFLFIETEWQSFSPLLVFFV